MTNILPYSYSMNEEIARWTFEVFIDHQSKGKWWIAFTNPTAGPWKKILSKDEAGQLIEIYRFSREEDRPDIVAVSDELKKVIIIEAKDYASKLIGKVQMTKSAQVIVDMEKVLRSVDITAWEKRKNYEIIPGFLWYSESSNIANKEVVKVTDAFIAIRDTLDQSAQAKDKMPLNIVIRKNDEGLAPFIYEGRAEKDISLFKA